MKFANVSSYVVNTEVHQIVPARFAFRLTCTEEMLYHYRPAFSSVACTQECMLPTVQRPQQYTAPPGASGASLAYIRVENLTIVIAAPPPPKEA